MAKKSLFAFFNFSTSGLKTELRLIPLAPRPRGWRGGSGGVGGVGEELVSTEATTKTIQILAEFSQSFLSIDPLHFPYPH